MDQTICILLLSYCSVLQAETVVDVFSLREFPVPTDRIGIYDIYENAEVNCDPMIDVEHTFEVIDLYYDAVKPLLGCYVKITRYIGDSSDNMWLATMKHLIEKASKYMFVAVTPHRSHATLTNEGEYAFLAESSSQPMITEATIAWKLHISDIKRDFLDLNYYMWEFKMKIDATELRMKGLKRHWMHTIELLSEVDSLLNLKVLNFHWISFQRGLTYRILALRTETPNFSPFELSISDQSDIESKCCYRAHEFHSCTVNEFVLHRSANILGCMMDVQTDGIRHSTTETEHLQDTLSYHRPLNFLVISGRYEYQVHRRKMIKYADVKFGIVDPSPDDWTGYFSHYGFDIQMASQTPVDGRPFTKWFEAKIFRASPHGSQGPHWYKAAKFLLDIQTFYALPNIYLKSLTVPRVKAVKYFVLLPISEEVKEAVNRGTAHWVIENECCPKYHLISFHYLHCAVLEYFITMEFEVVGCSIELHVETDTHGKFPKPPELKLGPNVYAFPQSHEEGTESRDANGFEINFSLASLQPDDSEDLSVVWSTIVLEQFPDATLTQTSTDRPSYTLQINDLSHGMNVQDFWIQALLLLHQLEMIAKVIVENIHKFHVPKRQDKMLAVLIMLNKGSADAEGCARLSQIATDAFALINYRCTDLSKTLDASHSSKVLIHLVVDTQSANVNRQDPFAELQLNGLLAKPDEKCETAVKFQPDEDHYDSPLTDISLYTSEENGVETKSTIVELSVCAALVDVLETTWDQNTLISEIHLQGCESIKDMLLEAVVACQLLVEPTMTDPTPKACFQITVGYPGEKPTPILPRYVTSMLNGDSGGCRFNVRYLNVHKWNGRSK